MYFWDVNALVAQLRRGPVPQADALRYVLAGTVILAAGSGVPGLWNARTEPALPVEWFGYVIGVALTVIGTLAAYRANGGREGADFAARYVALSWVLGIRFVVMGLLPIIVIITVLTAVVAARTETFTAESYAGSTAVAVVLCILLEMLYYWRMSHHFARAASPAHADMP